MKGPVLYCTVLYGVLNTQIDVEMNKTWSWTVVYMMYVCIMLVITYSRAWINRARLPILLVVS